MNLADELNYQKQKDAVNLKLMQDLLRVHDEFNKKVEHFEYLINEKVGPKGEDGEDGRTPTDAELLVLIKPLIPDVKDGSDGQDAPVITDEHLLSLMRPLVAHIKDGKTPSKKELQRIDVQYSIDKQDRTDDTRIDPADLADQIAIIDAQYAISKRNKQREIAQVNENKAALQAAFDLIPE